MKITITDKNSNPILICDAEGIKPSNVCRITEISFLPRKGTIVKIDPAPKVIYKTGGTLFLRKGISGSHCDFEILWEDK